MRCNARTRCDPPVLTEAERDVLLQTAWELNEYVPPPVDCPTHSAIVGHRSGMFVEQCGSRLDNADRPGDVCNMRGDVRAMLEQHGWVRVKAGGSGGNEYWRRPGKATSWSATLKDSVLYVFSANADPFESNRAYSPFAVYTLLEHGGDWSRAASALRAQGYGSPPASMDMSSPGMGPTVNAAPVTLEPLTVRDLIGTFPDLRKPVIHDLQAARCLVRAVTCVSCSLLRLMCDRIGIFMRKRRGAFVGCRDSRPARFFCAPIQSRGPKCNPSHNQRKTPDFN